MRRHRRAILALQWVVVMLYLALLIVPAFLPLPPSGATLLSNLTLFAQFAFWGLWWPFVMLSVMLMGRVWCGVLCPEGALTEWASRRGLGRAIPRWMRWSGWPFVAFVSTTVYGQLVSVYEYPKAALLVLGGSTLAAVVVGFVYGRGTRVWCRHLCPANGVFALLARIAPVHFALDEQAWKRHAGRAPRVDCAPLVDLRHMRSAGPCHACGRCSGHRGAIHLAARPPSREILAATPKDVTHAEALLLLFGVLGLALGTFHWTVSPWFVAAKQRAAEWLVEREWYGMLQDDAPWWLLTHYPEANDVFTWLDGALIAGYLFASAVIVGGVAWCSVAGAAQLVRDPRVDWRVLSLCLVPLAGASVFLGLSMLTLAQLRAEGAVYAWVPATRAVLLAGGIAWAVWLGARRLRAAHAPRARRMASLACYSIPPALVATLWYLPWRVW
ncbi:MAG: 4Fe-4S binding protein [Betaproteobacteria bacterium]|nr:MAG: 4Fe-4S binding protein [Betaproteobacteria bacterium]